jgi:hypothetical protein
VLRVDGYGDPIGFGHFLSAGSIATLLYNLSPNSLWNQHTFRKTPMQ